MNRWNYALMRLLQAIPTFFIIMFLVFMLVRLLPGDPASAILGDRATEEMVARINARLGLDQPLAVQFGYFVRNFFQGRIGRLDLLQDSRDHVDSSAAARHHVPGALCGDFGGADCRAPGLSGGPAPGFADRQHNSRRLSGGPFAATFSTSACCCSRCSGARLGLFPIGGYGETFLQHFYYLFLPALTLGFGLAAVLMRNLRAAVIEVLTADYVDFARAKGLRNRVVLSKHVLRNALISTVTLLGLNIGTLFGGAVITETVFAIPGVGRLMVDAIYGRDYAVIQALTLTFAIMVFIVFLITDLVYAQLDPRVEMA